MNKIRKEKDVGVMQLILKGIIMRGERRDHEDSLRIDPSVGSSGGATPHQHVREPFQSCLHFVHNGLLYIGHEIFETFDRELFNRIFFSLAAELRHNPAASGAVRVFDRSLDEIVGLWRLKFTCLKRLIDDIVGLSLIHI